MKAELNKDGNLVITIEFSEKGYESASGKTKVHASTHGNQPTTISVSGKPLVIGLNAYTRK